MNSLDATRAFLAKLPPEDHYAFFISPLVVIVKKAPHDPYYKVELFKEFRGSHYAAGHSLTCKSYEDARYNAEDMSRRHGGAAIIDLLRN
jgi:hypothetical protein